LYAGLARSCLVSALANDVKACCQAKRVFSDAKVDLETVVIAGGGNKLRVKPATGNVQGESDDQQYLGSA
jgi:hypothetical protein